MFMILDNFIFEALKISFDELGETREYRFAKNEGLGASKILYQYLGGGAKEVSIKGVLMPMVTSGKTKIKDLERMASRGRAYVLSDGEGKKLGRFLIQSIETTEQFFLENGRAQKIDFSLKLAKV